MKKLYFAGIDVGGTNTAIGIVDSEGHVETRGGISTKNHPEINDYIECLYKETARLAGELGGIENIAAVGIGAPNINRKEEIAFAENLPWSMPVPLAELVRRRFDLPVAIDNDANAAAFGEMIYGAAKGMENFITVTLGTGVGAGVVCDGNIVRGHRGFGGELGHLKSWHPGQRPCTCGKKGCIEAYCSATGVARTAREMLAENPDRESLLRQLAPEEITSRHVYDAAIKGDTLAHEIFDFTGEILGEALAEFMTISDPEAFVLYGGLTLSGELLLKPVRDSFRRHLMPLFSRYETPILVSTLPGADAAILGAAAMAIDAYRKSI